MMLFPYLLVAQSDTTSGSGATDIITMLFQYGLPGLVIAALLVGLLWAKPSVDRLIKDKEKAEAQRDELLRIYEEKMLPALTDSIVVTRDLKPVIQEVTTVLAQVREDLSRKGRS
jgi:molybdopterin biosynthesis enzyme